MIQWLKEHWILAAGAVIGFFVLIKLLGRNSTAGGNATGPGGTQVVYGGTNANDAAVQVAQLNSQSQLAAQQIAGSIAVQQGTLALAAQKDTNATDLSIEQVKAANALAITNSNNQLGLAQAQIGGNVALAQTAAARDVALTQANNALTLGLDTNETNLAALRDTNATKLRAYSIQGQVVNNQTNALRDIAVTQTMADASTQQKYIDARTQLQSEYMSTQQSELNSLLGSSSFDLKSQHGGANSEAALAAILNPAAAGVASVGASAADTTIDAPQNNAAIIGAIGGAVKNFVGAFA